MRPGIAQLSHKGRIGAVGVIAFALMAFGLPTASACSVNKEVVVSADCLGDGTREITYTFRTEGVSENNAKLTVSHVKPSGSEISPDYYPVATGSHSFTFKQIVHGDEMKAEVKATLTWATSGKSESTGGIEFREECSVPTTFTLTASAECEDDGTRIVTYSGTNPKRNRPATLTVSEVKPAGGPPIPSQNVSGNGAFTFTQTIPGIKGLKVSATATLTWGAASGSDASAKTDGSKSKASATASFTTETTCHVPTTFTLTASAGDCLTDGTRVVTYTGETSKKRAHFRVSDPEDPASDPSSGKVGSDGSFTFRQIIKPDTKSASATVILTWGHDQSEDSESQLEVTEPITFAGCTVKPPVEEVTTSEEIKDCTSKTVTTTTATTITDWVLEGGVWVAKTTITPGAQTRPTTAEECPVKVPDKPKTDAAVTSTDTSSCDSTSVTITKVTTTPDWTLVGNSWVPSEPVVTKSVSTRPKTAAETAECPVTPAQVVVPTDPSAVVVETESAAVISAEVALPAVVPAAEAVNPLPVAAAAGQADTNELQIVGGLTGFAAFLMLGLSAILRRRRGEA